METEEELTSLKSQFKELKELLNDYKESIILQPNLLDICICYFHIQSMSSVTDCASSKHLYVIINATQRNRDEDHIKKINTFAFKIMDFFVLNTLRGFINW